MWRRLDTPSPDGGRIIRQRPGKMLPLGVAVLNFVAAWLWLWVVRLGGGRLLDVRVVAASAFLLLALGAAVILLLLRTTVEIGPRGLTVNTMGRRRTHRWSALSGFGIVDVRWARMVVFDDADLAPSRWVRVNREMTGVSSGLPAMLEIEPEELVRLLEAARARWK